MVVTTFGGIPVGGGGVAPDEACGCQCACKCGCQVDCDQSSFSLNTSEADNLTYETEVAQTPLPEDSLTR